MDQLWVNERARGEEIGILFGQGKFKQAWTVYSHGCMRGAYGDNWVRVHPKITVWDNIFMAVCLVFGMFLVVSWLVLCMSSSAICLAFTDKGIFREIALPLRWILTNR